jgi:hypothetical protein
MSQRPTLPLRERKDIVIPVLDGMGIVKRIDQGDQITYAFGDETQTIRTRITFSDPDLISICSWPEFNMPVNTREKTVEFLNKRNFMSKIGCLEMEVETGEVRFRTSLHHGNARSLTGIITTFLTLHQTYFAKDIYRKLVLLRDPTNDIPVDSLL